jgi:hypothetical protein
MDHAPSSDFECIPCKDLIGAGPRIDPHRALNAAKDSGEKYLYRCAMCRALWTLAAQGWARLID